MTFAVHISHSSTPRRAQRLAATLVLICAALVPAPLWAQASWQYGTNTISTPAGNSVGIGTTSPSGTLTVVGTGSNHSIDALSGQVYINWSSGYAPLWVQQLGSGPAAYFTGGNVGIGTTTPIDSLHVQGGNIRIQTADASNAELRIRKSDGTGWSIYRPGSSNDLRFWNGANLFTVQAGGNVGIGTTAPQYKLSVNGTIQGKEVIVNTGWADYVFKPGYQLKQLNEVAAYIRQHHHLPEIPSETEIQAKGVSLGGMQSKLLAKIEELTLHMIQADERNTRLEGQNRELQDRVARLEAQGSSGEGKAARTVRKRTDQ